MSTRDANLQGAAQPQTEQMAMTQKNLPYLFLPGVMEGGTTSLAATLELHPDVFLIAMKEPNFFAQRPESREKLYQLLSPDSTT